VARRKKRVVDLVRDGTFLARKDAPLLGTADELPWPRLEEYRRTYRLQTDPDLRHQVALELERQLREPDAQVRLLGRLRDELDRLGPRDSFRRLERFFPRFFRHFEGPAAGQRYTLAPNHREFLREFWRRDRHGRRIYQVGLLMEPKGNGKTPLSAGLGTYALVDEEDAPNVYVISGQKKQADFCHGFAKANVEEGALAAWLSVAGMSIEYPETRGVFEILSADGDLSAGSNPSAAVFDELFLFRHRHQREAWASQTQALHKRSGRAWALGISTAGYDKQTVLGETYDAALAHPRLEVLDDGFHLRLRDEEAGLLFWCHEVPLDADIENPAVIRRANPAPWVQPRDLVRALNRPGADENDWRRLHANQWTAAKSAWLSSGIWARLEAELEIPEGAEILVGIDCARSFDTTAICWLWISPEGRKVLRTHVWSVRANVPHDTLVRDRELVNEELVEPFVAWLDAKYRVRAIGFDPRYFSAEARHLAADGHVVVEVEPASSTMGDFVAQFEKDALAGALAHDGDRVLAGHVNAIEAIRRPDGSKKIGKRSEAYPVDAGMAAVIANGLATLDLPERDTHVEVWTELWT